MRDTCVGLPDRGASSRRRCLAQIRAGHWLAAAPMLPAHCAAKAALTFSSCKNEARRSARCTLSTAAPTATAKRLATQITRCSRICTTNREVVAVVGCAHCDGVLRSRLSMVQKSAYTRGRAAGYQRPHLQVVQKSVNTLILMSSQQQGKVQRSCLLWVERAR